MDFDFVFAIYSCKKNLDIKTTLLFHFIHEKLPNCKCYIVYGDNRISTEYEIDDKYLILNCGDNYDDLSPKTIMLFRVIEKIHPTIKGVFKCDDDILPNINKLKELFTYILNQEPEIHYLGNVLKKEQVSYEGYHISKIQDKKYDKKLITYSCSYTSGPLYYLSMYAVKVFNQEIMEFTKDKETTEYFYEDNIVGYILNSRNIFHIHYKTYYDYMNQYNLGSIQNIDNNIRHLFVNIHGGLGNQLFQVAAAYGIAKKHNMHMVLVYSSDHYTYHMTHNTHRDEFFSTIFKDFNVIDKCHIDFSNVITYNEPRCFDYNDNIIQHHSNYYLEGYFQNKQYLDTEIIELFRNKNNNIENPLLEESYFLHVRRGDYVHNRTYIFDTNSYFMNAINYITNKEENLHVHFYIVSDDIEYCKQNFILQHILCKTFIEEKMSTLDTLYFMSLCKKGGICSNSTFSGWATRLNMNSEKTVVVPKQWINIDYPYAIPFEYTVAI